MLVEQMDYEGAFLSLTEATITQERLDGWQKTLHTDANGVWDILALELARRFLKRKLAFGEADHIANRLWYWMLTFSSPECSLPTDATDVFLAFDSGEVATEDGTDPVATLTFPQLQSVLDRTGKDVSASTTSNSQGGGGDRR